MSLAMEITYEIDGLQFTNFTEDDITQQETIADDLCLRHLPHYEINLPHLRSQFSPASEIDEALLDQCINLIESNIGDLYARHKGANWKEEKLEEMSEPGLIVLWFTDPAADDDDDLAGFISFKLCLDDDDIFVLYLFEIHLAARYQGRKLGQMLIDQFHQFVEVGLQRSENALYRMVRGTSLTVFSDNTRALSWYKSMGYGLIDSSPRDRTLRSGKIVKPEYYLMRRDLE
ncbi:uncharacterized protein LODBEIA_P51960 [Lodderomyces beijingensis]|uniref:N-alpha-acetyltransferase 40 n=1 Tax=Lodderomyces beijingensis TaxID=1775926 RepID=A0ABP0ZUG2_9ASCO